MDRVSEGVRKEGDGEVELRTGLVRGRERVRERVSEG